MTTPARPLAALIVFAALGASAPATHAATRCSAPKIAWKVEGRTVCAKAPRATATPSPLNAALAGTWITSASDTAPGGRTLVPQRLRRAIPRLAQSTTTLAKRVIALPAKPRLRAVGGRGRVVLVDEVELDRKVQPDGTVVIVKIASTFGPVDCPPGFPLPTYTGDIAAVVHSRTQADLATGGGLRPFGADLRIAEQGLSGILGAAGMDVTAEWALMPAD
ncbi:MAG: hypothetical protein ACSLFR_02125 [Solirubrobacteraceae bacterium]